MFLRLLRQVKLRYGLTLMERLNGLLVVLVACFMTGGLSRTPPQAQREGLRFP